MTIDRDDWKYGFRPGSMPQWTCPTCNQGVLQVADGKNGTMVFSFVFRASLGRTRRQEQSPLDEEGPFSAMLRCSRTECGEYISVCGQSGVDQEFDERGEAEYVAYFTPLFFYPAIRVFQPPAKCPPSLLAELEAAFAVYWCDTSACLNHIRSAIEHLLTSLGVARLTPARKRLSLDARINAIPAKYAGLAKELHALRWLGNVGSHGGKLTKDDALDGFELLQHVLEERFDPRAKRIGAISSGIIKRKGSRKRT